MAFVVKDVLPWRQTFFPLASRQQLLVLLHGWTKLLHFWTDFQHKSNQVCREIISLHAMTRDNLELPPTGVPNEHPWWEEHSATLWTKMMSLYCQMFRWSIIQKTIKKAINTREFRSVVVKDQAGSDTMPTPRCALHGDVVTMMTKTKPQPSSAKSNLRTKARTSFRWRSSPLWRNHTLARTIRCVRRDRRLQWTKQRAADTLYSHTLSSF